MSTEETGPKFPVLHAAPDQRVDHPSWLPLLQSVDSMIIETGWMQGQTAAAFSRQSSGVAAAELTTDDRRLPLKCRCHAEAEGLAWLAQLKLGGKAPDRLIESKIAGGSGWEHISRDRHRPPRRSVQSQRVVGPVDPEGSVDDGQKHLQFHPRGHSRNPVGAAYDLQLSRERRALQVASGAIQGNIERRTAKH